MKTPTPLACVGQRGTLSRGSRVTPANTNIQFQRPHPQSDGPFTFVGPTHRVDFLYTAETRLAQVKQRLPFPEISARLTTITNLTARSARAQQRDHFFVTWWRRLRPWP